jgi:Leucine-rich repeat (LRR) protein
MASHVFLSHSTADKPAVEELARRLANEGIEAWLDKWNLIPGEPWQPALEEALQKADSCAVFVGRGGLGSWQTEEMRAAIDRRVSESHQKFRVIPVLLPGAEKPERGRLPSFLAAATWVEFRGSLDDPDAFHRLVCGIRGVAPGRQNPAFPRRVTHRGLTETRQYLIACTSVVAAIGGLWLAVAKAGLPKEVLYAAAVPFLLVFCFTTLPRWHEEHRKRWLISRSRPSEGTDQSEAYFQITPYSSSQRTRYHRADDVHRQILQWVVTSREPILILTGHSGTGKSSLLEAYLTPELQNSQPPFRVIKVRTLGRPETQLRQALLQPGAVWKNPPERVRNLATPELVRQAAEWACRGGRASRLVVVLDQFEEALILREEAPEEFAALRGLFNALTASPVLGLTVLLALRSDYKALLGTAGVPPLDERTNWRELPAFSPTAAAEFLTAPESGLVIEQERLRHVLKEAAALDGTRGLVRPIVLNMLGRILQRLANSPEADKPTRALLTADVRRAIEERPELRAVARQVLPTLLTEADTKHPRTVAEIHEETGLDERVVLGFLQEFGLSGYVREIGQEAQDSHRLWEFSHDFVARLVGQVIKTPTQDAWTRLKPILYPLSMILWAAGIIALIAFYPWIERNRVEEKLRWKYHFSVAPAKIGAGYALAQTNPHFTDLAGACPWLLKFGQILELDFSDCKGLTGLQGLPELPNLQTLNLSSCDGLRSLRGLPQLQNLQTLNLSYCNGLRSLRGLPQLQNLQTLDLIFCEGLTSLRGLPQLQNLQRLDLTGCKRLTSLQGLPQLQNLQRLDLGGCDGLTSFEGLPQLQSLQTLDLGDCDGLTSLQGLPQLQNLQTLELGGCKRLTSLQGLPQLQNLQRLDLSGCDGLTSLQGLPQLQNLQRLQLTGCKRLEWTVVNEFKAKHPGIEFTDP